MTATRSETSQYVVFWNYFIFLPQLALECKCHESQDVIMCSRCVPVQGGGRTHDGPSVNTQQTRGRTHIPRAEPLLSHWVTYKLKSGAQVTYSWWEVVQGDLRKRKRCWIVLGKPKSLHFYKRRIWNATISSKYLNSWTRCAVILDPDPPNGWPKAMAPPFTLVLLGSRSKLCCTAKYWGAKASFTLKTIETLIKILIQKLIFNWELSSSSES